MSRIALLALCLAAVPLGSSSAGPAFDEDSSYQGPRWSTDWVNCEGYAPAERGCSLRTRFRGFAFPGDVPFPYLVVACKDPQGDSLWPNPTGNRRLNSPSFHGDIRVEVRGEHGGHSIREVRCEQVGRCIVCASLDERPEWGKWDELTVTVTVDGVGPWGVGVGIFYSKVPDQPRRLSWERSSGGRVDLSFVTPRHHGARITGYRSRCLSGSRKASSSVRGKQPRLRVPGLIPGRVYECSVAALSNKGVGWWSEPVRVKLKR